MSFPRDGKERPLNVDSSASIEIKRIGFCRIIPVDELPENFDRRYFGWVDTPENRKAIKAYCEKYC